MQALPAADWGGCMVRREPERHRVTRREPRHKASLGLGDFAFPGVDPILPVVEIGFVRFAVAGRVFDPLLR